MFALALYGNEVPLFYIRSPKTPEDISLTLDSLVYSTVSEFKLKVGFLSKGATVIAYSLRSYRLVILTDKNMIIGYFKDLLYDLRAKLVPYEGQEVEETLKPYGVRLVESLDKAYLYVPRRANRRLRTLYKRLILETGHESFGIDCEDYVIVFTRKGVVFGEGNIEPIDKADISIIKEIEKEIGKKPKALILPSGPRTVRSLTLRALLGRRYSRTPSDEGEACR